MPTRWPTVTMLTLHARREVLRDWVSFATVRDDFLPTLRPTDLRDFAASPRPVAWPEGVLRPAIFGRGFLARAFAAVWA